MKVNLFVRLLSLNSSLLGIAESHTRPVSQPWSPPYTQPSNNLLTKWAPQDYSQQYNGSNNRHSAPQQQQHHFTDL